MNADPIDPQDPPDPPDPPTEEENRGRSVLDSALPFAEIAAAVTVLFTAVGGLAISGLLHRTQVNHGRLFTVSIALVVLAATVWLVAALSERRDDRRLTADQVAVIERGESDRRRLRIAGLALAASGLIAGFYAAIWTQGETEVPSVEASIDSATGRLTATVKVTDVSSKEYLAVRVEGLQDLEPIRPLYLGSFGPDDEGDIEKTITLDVPSKEFEHVGIKAFTSKQEQKCSYARPLTEEGQGSGCVVFAMDVPARRPTIQVRFGPRRLTVRISAGRTGRTSVAVRVVGLVGNGGRRRLATIVRDDVSGVVNFSFVVPNDSGLRRVCVEAKFADRVPSSRLPCPVKVQVDRDATYFDVVRARAKTSPTP